VTERQRKILSIIRDPARTHGQTAMALAKQAENLLEIPGVPPGYAALASAGSICDLNEGQAPYTPRWVLPDYGGFLQRGSDFLRLSPPEDLHGALTALLILYHHVPSVTRFPAFIGRLDELLEPFVQNEDTKTATKLIEGFLLQIDRTITDSCCQANIGPQDTRTGRIILKCLREMHNRTPNLTLRYDPAVTPDAFAAECAATALCCANPAFANHPMFTGELGGDYGIAGCYSGLPAAGGAFTLTRLILARVADSASSADDFFSSRLPEAIGTMCGFMDAKIRFLVEQTPFFQHHFLVREGLIDRERFNGLFGIAGLCECVNRLMQLEGKQGRFGPDGEANALGLRVMEAVKERVAAHKNPYCAYWNHTFMLHAQAGIDADADLGISPGARIAIGEEMALYDHLRQAGMFHRYFPSGAGDTFAFDAASARNPDAVVDIVKGAFSVGLRYLSVYGADGGLLRITGYLVKNSDIARLERGVAALPNTALPGIRAVHSAKIRE
jgi:YjjI family glycine radical enzyme